LYAAVIPLTIQRILRGENPVIDGDGKQTRDFTYVTDMVAAALKMLECDGVKGKILNVGYGKDIEIQTLVQIICHELGHQTSNIIYGPQRPSDVRRLIADCSQAKLLLNYNPKIGLDEGLRMTIEWSKTNTSGT
jgi:nucleoside-diphosphate-sugar epimerase